MKLTYTLFSFLLLLCSITAFSQTITTTAKPNLVKGVIIDSASNVKLLNASIAILRAKDSTLVKYTRASASGAFTISNIGKGTFILLVTYPAYADYVDRFTLDSVKTQRNFGNIDMQLKSKLLKEVIIKGEVAAIKIKGDTTEYNAKAYKIQPNAKVEDLLKQLQGITVDKDGKITAQGQTVEKVLVDGEEFFGDDPTLVTKNIRADMVDKVQLYDKKSDQASFTGVDDGSKTKTINIKLKEDKKNGYFGKVDAGIGTNGYYQEQVLYNQFKGKKKFSAYGTLSNTGKTGLGWEDSNKLGTGNSEVSDDGGIYFFGGGDDLDSFDGRYNGQGIPVARTGGLHFDNKWDKDKKSINTNYKIGSLGVTGSRNILSQQSLPGSSAINSNTDQTYDNYVFRQKLDATYIIKPDTLSTFKFSVDGTLKNSTTNTGSAATSSREDGTLLNRNNRTLTNDVDQKLFNASALYTRKFKKAGRLFSLGVNTSLTDSKAHGFLNSELDLYDKTGSLDSTQLINQLKTNDTKTSRVAATVTYTEPLTKFLGLALSYGISTNNSNADRKSFDQSAPGVYNKLNDSLSNHYVFNQTSNQGGAFLTYKRGKYYLTAGTRVADVRFKQVDEINHNESVRNFTNWSPSAYLSYRFSQYRSVSVNYYGNQTQPTIDQIQPVKVNTDPLNIVLGNPDLRPSFTNSFSTYYNSYKVIGGESIYVNGSYSFTTNPIVSNTVTDTTLGKSTTQSLNLPGKQPINFRLNFNYGRKIAGFSAGLGGSANGSVYYGLINSAVNRTKSYTYSGRININRNVTKKYDFYASAGPSYTVSQSSLQTQINNNGRGFTAYSGLNVYLPGKIQIGSDVDYTYRAPTQTFKEDFKQTILNANITKAFLKGENLKLSITGNDLLNQNTGFSRNASSNYITQTRNVTIRRYFMLSVVWDFSGFGKAAAATPAPVN